MKRVAVIIHRMGPYHVARLNAAGRLAQARGGEVVGIEVAGDDTTYDWQVVAGADAFTRRCLFKDATYEALGKRQIRAALRAALDDLCPDAVALPGWAFPEVAAGLDWCRRHGAGAILMSDSAEEDYARNSLKEWIKRRIVRRYSAALVAGQPHARYAVKLGAPPDRIFSGYDVVDNAHFARGAQVARSRAALLRQQQGLPAQFFMAMGRFIPVKNLALLVEAYRRYREETSEEAWGLVICGDGPLKNELAAAVTAAGLESSVCFPGFVQYDQLPEVYGLASAFVHPSTKDTWGLVVNEAMAAGLPVVVSQRCGCAEDLVVEGENGFAFDPYDAEQLTGCLQRMADPATDRVAMGAASERLIAPWSPEGFGDALWKAAEASCADR